MEALKKIKTLAIILGKILLTCLAFYIISKRITINPLTYINKTSMDYFVVAIFIMFFVVILQAFRWINIAKIFSIHLSYSKSLMAIWFGHLVNNFLPTATAGDLLRSYTLRYADNKTRKWKWLGAFLSEKFSAASSALLVACFALMSSISHKMPLILMGFIILLFAGSVIFPIVMTKLLGSFPSLQHKKYMIYLHEVMKSFANAFLHSNGRSAFLISTLINVCMCVVFYIAALGLNVPVPFTECLFVVPVFTILATLPISYAGWGIRELSCVGLLSFFDISSNTAVIISIMYGLINLLSSIPGIFVAYPFFASIRQLSQQDAATG